VKLWFSEEAGEEIAEASAWHRERSKRFRGAARYFDGRLRVDHAIGIRAGIEAAEWTGTTGGDRAASLFRSSTRSTSSN